MSQSLKVIVNFTLIAVILTTLPLIITRSQEPIFPRPQKNPF